MRKENGFFPWLEGLQLILCLEKLKMLRKSLVFSKILKIIEQNQAYLEIWIDLKKNPISGGGN